MNRSMLTFCALLFLFSMNSSPVWGNKVFLESGGQVVAEAENFSLATPSDTHEWLFVPTGGLFQNPRGEGYIQALPDNGGSSGPLEPPIVEYKVRITTAGTYRLYVRWDANADSSDSFYANILELQDGSGGSVADWYRYTRVVTDADFATRPWQGDAGFERTDAVGGETAALWTIAEPGDYTVRFNMREDGAAIDAFILQLTSLPEPIGVGPPESVRVEDLVITSNLTAVTVGEFFSNELEVSGGIGPFTWSISNGVLPEGVILTGDGVLSGTPVEVGESEFTVEVADGNGDTAEKSFRLKIVFVLPPGELRVKKTGTVPVPGRMMEYFILVENIGNVTSAPGALSEVLFLPSDFTFIAANPTPVLQNELFVLWELPSLNPGELKIFQYQVMLNSTVEIGDGVVGPVILGEDFSISPITDVILDRIKQLHNEPLDRLKDRAKSFPCVDQDLLDRAIESCKSANDRCIDSNMSLPCTIQAAFCRSDLNEAFKDCKKADDNENGIPDICDLPTEIYSELACINARGARDPNEKLSIGPIFIQPDSRLVYPIHFENIGDIEARDVFIADVLGTNLDISTLELLTPDGGSIDEDIRTVRWDLLGRNLLPGETDNVLLAIKPLPNLPSGTEIRNTATIQFEIFETLETKEVVNIIDSTPPSCTMNPLPLETFTLDFPISWTATDAIGEIESLSVFVSEDGGGFKPFMEGTSNTTALFPGVSGVHYAFLCVAKDSAGNIEPQNTFAEVETRVVPRVEVPPVERLTQADAERSIVETGLMVGTISTAHDDNIQEGNVISQDPSAGELRPVGSKVNLIVSLGPSNQQIVCSFLGNDPKPSLWDQDIFRFKGKKGEIVTFWVEKSGNNHIGDRATLRVQGRKVDGEKKVDRSELPNKVVAEVPHDRYLKIIVAEQPLFSKGKRFRGDYCLTMETTDGAEKTLEPLKRWVEPYP